MAGHSGAAAVLALEDCCLAAVHGDASGVTHVRIRDGGRIDVVQPSVCGLADYGDAVVAAYL